MDSIIIWGQIVIRISSQEEEGEMDKWVPQCKPLKEQYDKCMDEWVEKKLINSTFGGTHTCAEPFDDYRDCVTLGMKLRNSKNGASVTASSVKKQ